MYDAAISSTSVYVHGNQLTVFLPDTVGYDWVSLRVLTNMWLNETKSGGLKRAHQASHMWQVAFWLEIVHVDEGAAHGVPPDQAGQMAERLRASLAHAGLAQVPLHCEPLERVFDGDAVEPAAAPGLGKGTAGAAEHRDRLVELLAVSTPRVHPMLGDRLHPCRVPVTGSAHPGGCRKAGQEQ